MQLSGSFQMLKRWNRLKRLQNAGRRTGPWHVGIFGEHLILFPLNTNAVGEIFNGQLVDKHP